MFDVSSVVRLYASLRSSRAIRRCFAALCLCAFTLPAMAGSGYRAINLEPTYYNAGSSPVGTATATQTAYVNVAIATTYGHSNQVIVRTAGSSTGTDFAVVTNSCVTSAQYSAGQPCTVTYTFTPSQSGLRTGALVMVDSTTGAVLGTSYLSGIGTGPQIGFAPAASDITTGLNEAVGVAVDGAGNLYVADMANSAIIKETPGTGGTYTASTLFSVAAPTAIAIDGAGNLYVTQKQTSTLLLALLGKTGYTTSNIGSGLNAASGVTVDVTGTIWIADTGNNRIQQLIQAATGQTYYQYTFGSGFSLPQGVAVDSLLNVYVADTGNNRLAYFPIQSNGTYPAATTLNDVYTPVAVLVDRNGSIDYVASNGYFFSITLAQLQANASGVLLAQSTYGSGLAQDGAGNLYLAEPAGSNRLVKFDTADAPIVSFAVTPVNATSSDSPKPIALTNSGNAPLSITSVATATTSFSSAVSTCTSSVAPLASCSISASFSPKSTGALTDGVLVSSNAFGSPLSVPLFGTSTLVTPSISIAPVTYSYSSGGSVTLTATITYSGTVQTPTGAFTFHTPSGNISASCFPGTGGAFYFGPYPIVLTSPFQCIGYASPNALNVGSYTLTGTLAGDANFATSSVSTPLTVAYGFSLPSLSIPSHTYGDAPFTLAASTGSDTNPVTYSINSGPATISGNLLTITGAGTVSVGYSQTTGGNYGGVTSSSSFTVYPKTLSAQVTGVTSKVYDGTTTATIRLPVLIFLTGIIGTDNITAAQAVGTYASAAPGSETVTVKLTAANFTAVSGSLSNYTLPTSASGLGSITAVAPAIALTGLPSLVYGASGNTLKASVTYVGGTAPTGAVSFSIGGLTLPATCTGTSSPLTCGASLSATALAAGTYTATANLAADATFLTASGSGSVTLTPATPTVSLTVPNHTFGDAPIALAATSSAPGATFTYTVTGGPATISGSTLTLTGAGTVSVSVTSPATGNYAQGSGATSFAVAQAAQTVTFTGLPATAIFGAAGPYLLASSSTSGLTATYSVSGPATLSGNTLTLTGAGTVAVVASQAGNTNYLAATPVTQTIVVQQTAAAPAFSPAAGQYAAGQMVTLTDTSAGAAIVYQINGGPVIPYTGPFALSGTSTITATASLNSGAVVSPVASAVYSIVSSVPTPSILPAGGTYTSNQTVTIADATAGTTIYYTINGGGQNLYTGPFVVSSSATIQSVAILSGVTSGVASAAYNLVLSVAAPVASPAGGATTYPAGQQVTLTSTTSGASIFYSINSGAFQVYSAPITLNTTETLHFYATFSTLNSGTLTSSYSIASAIAAPVFSLPTGTYPPGTIVSITEATPGTTIFYTLDNGPAQAYAGPITLTNTTLLRASAVDANNNTSAITSATLSITSGVANPVFSLLSGTYSGPQTLILTDPTAGATLYYSTDSINYVVYTGPITIAASETVYAGASLSGVYAAGSSATYTITP